MKKKNRKHFWLLLSSLLLLYFCAHANAPIEEINIENKTGDKTYWDELSSYLAGLPLDENNRFSPLAGLKYYKAYVNSMNKAWSKIEKNYIYYVTTWTKENIPINNSENTALYPLSGADFINLYHFYPNAPRYIMIGLETPGYVNDPIMFKPNELKNAFYTLDASLNQISSQNYFTTILMDKKFSNKYFPGVAPVLLVFLKRLGFLIDDLQRISIALDGTIKEIDESEVRNSPESYQGIRIFFHSNDNPKLRELIFLKLFLSPNSIDSASLEGRFLQKQKRLNLLLKSSIYLLHMEKYKDFINSILAKTDMVIEDDSGIPIRYFSPEDWDIQVFGKYTSRISIRYVTKEANMFKSDKGNVKTESKKFTQEDLKKIFASSAKPLLFKYGYGGASRNTTRNNLILLRRHSLLKSKS